MLIKSVDEIDLFLREDIGDGDITSSALLSDERGIGHILLKERAVIAGLQEADGVFERLGCETMPLVDEGCRLEKGTSVLEVSGELRALLAGERLALNFLARMSGIATMTMDMVEKCRTVNPRVIIAGTRKTTPGFRKWEKRAIVVGGGDPHRMGLWDAILIKDNHLAVLGIEEAMNRAKRLNKPIEIEVTNMRDAKKAARMGADVIMLDNVQPVEGERIAGEIRKIDPDVVIEVSGGITPENVERYASYADRISCGCLTHSVRAIDLSMDIDQLIR
jgi:nicotinate-nucleotide pyrophosphorylase (carboxylating)